MARSRADEGKRMVERTSTGEDGYLYTETVEVWEDIHLR